MKVRLLQIVLPAVVTIAVTSGCGRTYGYNSTVEESKPPVQTSESDKEPIPGAQTPGEREFGDRFVQETFNGKIASLGEDQFVVKTDSGDEQNFMVNDDTEYTVDGEDADFSDLKVGQEVEVTGEGDGVMIAKTVSATNG